ncbi:DNA methyltransferase [Streptomyces sp. 4N509B]|uniref:DNA methyltransferase n=1 Tax=Streptomyces sp. 4N509B TaxID=3457413 RepID=UPI003FD615FE
MIWFQLPQLPVDPQKVPRPGLVPLVWPTGQHGERLLDRGYAPDTIRDHQRVPPATAAFAIRALTPPGGTVVDPDCGTGTVVAEALRCGRHAVGIAQSRRWWTLTRANLTAVKREGATTDGMVLPTAGSQDMPATADLVLTAWRHPAVPTAGEPHDHNAAIARLTEMLTWSRTVLKPGGHVVIVTRPQRRHGYLLDAPGHIHRAAVAAHLAPVARCIALTVPIRNGRLILHPTTAQRSAAARAERHTGQPVTLPAHHDVQIFHAPPAHAAEVAVSSPWPDPLPLCTADARRRTLVDEAVA